MSNAPVGRGRRSSSFSRRDGGREGPFGRVGKRRADRTNWSWSLALAVVAMVAFLARLTLMLRGGGLSGSDGYDDSVYYAAATALIHGHLPYRDFVLLHPPGLILALTPFTAFAQLVSDRTGQEIARVAFMVLGAVNTVLVMRLGNRFGRVAGLVAGVVYAVSYPALYPERTTTLEALGNTTVLVALSLLVDPARRRLPDAPSRRRGGTWQWPTRLLVAAGVALGFGTTVKIWGVVALAVLTVWIGVAAGLRAATWLVAAAGATIVAVCLPFYLAAPHAMWRMVVVDQLSRPRSSSPLTSRFSTLVGLTSWLPRLPHVVVQVVVLVMLSLLVVSMIVAARILGAQVLVVLLVAHTGVLLASPNLYLHYASLVWVPGALVLGIAADRAWIRLSSDGHRTRAWVCLTAALAAVILYGAPGVVRGKGNPLDPALATAAIRVPGCITADDPTYLIAMNVLSRNLRDGCPVWIDPTGIAIDRAGNATDKPYASASNPLWQQSVMAYLLSGDATMVARQATNLNRSSRTQITRLPVIVSANGFTLRRVR